MSSASEKGGRAAAKSPPAHLVSAAAAYERILNNKYPDQDWIVTVRDDWDTPRESATDAPQASA